jgi:DNA-binding response OmpR family regulator
MNRVLVVDDEKPILELIVRQLETLGFIPLDANTAEAALRIFKEKKPGIVISDLNLGRGMDGVSLCSRIRYDDPSVAVIAMSGFFSEYDKTFCLSAGFSDFLEKPVDTNELNSAIQCAFERRSRWMKID